MTTANLPIAQRIAHLLYPNVPPIERSTALVLIGAVLLAISAKIQIPSYPVPQTLQTMIVLLVGMAYGSKLGVATVLLYLMAGAMGLPIFAGTPEKGIGWAYMIGPSGGYLLGFIFAAAACGVLARRGWNKNLWEVGLAMIIGNIIIYALGLLWLGHLIGWYKQVLQFGMLNFLLGDVVKIIFALLIYRRLLKHFVGMSVMSKDSSDAKNYDDIRIVLLWGIIILFAILISVMLFPYVKNFFSDLTGVTLKPELLKFIGWGISGLIATLGVIGLLKRTDAWDEQNKLAEKGHIHERFKVATEHLGSTSASIRIASFNEFYRLAKITKTINEEESLKDTIFDILCAHLRETTKQQNYTNNIKPTEEMQSLLNILFKQENKDIFSGLNANVAETHLQGANLKEVELRGDLQGAKLQMADLQGAKLQGANLQGAMLQLADLRKAKMREVNLQKAMLQGADMREANLREAMLQRAELRGAMLQEADLREANLRWAKLQLAKLRGAMLQKAEMRWAELQGANLQLAKLQGVILREAQLQGAELQEANLRGAKLEGADLQGANLQWAELQEAQLHGANLQEANLREAELQGANLQKANLHGANLQEADMQEAKIDQFAMNNMPDDWKKVVKKYKGEDGKEKTGALLVDDKGTVIEYL